jgi:hypothetical protein
MSGVITSSGIARGGGKLFRRRGATERKGRQNKYLKKNDLLLSTDFKLFNLLARIRGE